MLFEPWLVGSLIGGAASTLSLVHHYRDKLGPMTWREVRQLASLPVTPIGQAREGLVKIVGTLGAGAPVMGYYHRVPCVAVELHHYEVVASPSGARRLLTQSEKRLQTFWVEDETGRVAIDPEVARIDYEVEGEDLESTVEEHRLRVGAKVAVLGVVRRSGPRLSQPMRKASADFDNGLEFAEPPLVTWRTEPEVYPRLRPPVGGIALSASAIAMAVLSVVLGR